MQNFPNFPYGRFLGTIIGWFVRTDKTHQELDTTDRNDRNAECFVDVIKMRRDVREGDDEPTDHTPDANYLTNDV